jgi:hypothetical protein
MRVFRGVQSSAVLRSTTCTFDVLALSGQAEQGARSASIDPADEHRGTSRCCRWELAK